jgi:hypothetical protein
VLLVVGAPRSGTTWLAKIFDSHPRVVYRHEPDSIHRTAEIPPFNTPPYESHTLEAARSYLLELCEVQTIKVMGVLPTFPKTYFTRPAFALQRTLVTGFKVGEHLPIVGDKVARISFPNLRRADKHVSVVMKSIDALGRVSLFMAACPSLKTILIVRNPYGHIASVLRGIRMKKFEGSVPITEDLGIYKLLAGARQARDLGVDFAAFKAMPPVQRLAWHWAICNIMALEALRDCPRGRVIRYEDLCDNPVDLSKSLFAFVGLEWNMQTESFVNVSTESSGAERYYQIFRDPKQSAHKWRNELTADQMDQVSCVVEQLPAWASVLKNRLDGVDIGSE